MRFCPQRLQANGPMKDVCGIELVQDLATEGADASAAAEGSPWRSQIWRFAEVVPLQRGAAFGLWVMAIAYTGLGIFYLLADSTASFPIDLRLRWVEERLCWDGVNPHTAGHPDNQLPETHESMRAVGGSYPPWSYAVNLFVTPPLPWHAARWYFAVLSMASLAVVVHWCFASERATSGRCPGLAAPAVLAMFPMAICTSYGQTGVLILALLVAACELHNRHQPWAAGLFLAGAMVKPQWGALFLLPGLVRGEWRHLSVVLTILTVASCLVAWHVGTDPLSMLAAAGAEAKRVAPLSHNPIILLSQSWFGFRMGTLLNMSALGAIALILCFLLRNERSYLSSFGVCAVLSMFWMYRKHYDCVLMAFPMVSLVCLTRQTRSVLGAIMATLLGASLWLPICNSNWDLSMLQWTHAAIWLSTMACILLLEKTVERPCAA